MTAGYSPMRSCSAIVGEDRSASGASIPSWPTGSAGVRRAPKGGGDKSDVRIGDGAAHRSNRRTTSTIAASTATSATTTSTLTRTVTTPVVPVAPDVFGRVR